MTKINTVANNGLTIVENYNKLLEQFRKAKTIDDVRILVASAKDFISVYKRVDKNMVNEIYGKCSLLSHCSVDSEKAKHLLCTGMTLTLRKRKSLFQSLWV